jgi:predicted nucleotidyltransferase
LAEDLEGAGIEFAVVGGLAVSARTEPRFTRDVDVAVDVPGDREAEALVKRLRSIGYELESLVEQDRAGRLATARLVPPGGELGGIVVDLLFASCGVEPEIVREAEAIDFLEGLKVRVASMPYLTAMKVLSRDDVNRPQDIADLRALLKKATPEEIRIARAVLRRISERGFGRGKDLEAELDGLL